MSIPFTKMQGLGNDFIIIEEDRLPLDTDLSELAKELCNRHFGIGSDGLVLVSAADNPDCDIRFKFLNPDGSTSEMCGNGIRCFAKYVKDQGIIKSAKFKVETDAGIIIPQINADQTVTVDMGPPRFSAEEMGFAQTAVDLPIKDFPLRLDTDKVINVTLVSMGNPHCIIFESQAPEWFDIKVHGPQIENHTLFTNRTNVEWVKKTDEQTLDVVVWERGAGFTLACGTGACASAVAALLHGFVTSPVTVYLPGGALVIEWQQDANVMMTGPAAYVFSGQLDEKSHAIV